MTKDQRRLADEHDDHEKTKSTLRVLKMASSGTIRAMRVQIERLKVDRARAQGEAASAKVALHGLKVLMREWESRTGLDMDKVLEGVYGKPWGIYGHEELTDDPHT
jgi:hypothetical protein